ncbi:MAG: DUF4157 domain-containing protein [Gemmatimonadaceae bacterium]|nr:DUF4157 domain-containing protein [Chitinophagaceae bacterium]
MSYSSRNYRQRNAHTHEESSKDAFFGKQSDSAEASNAIFQAKMEVNKPGDKYEKEADAVADAVTNDKNAGPVQKKETESIQRLATSPEDEKLATNDQKMKKDKEIQEKPIQKKEDESKPMDEEKKKKPGSIQKKSDGNAVASPVLSSKIEGAGGKGKAMDPATMQEMNASFGRDFSDVKMHSDSESEKLNEELKAQAFTQGKDIYFNKDKYSPQDKEGKNLLAHELTHVVQQNSDK